MKIREKRAFPGGNTSVGSYSYFNNIVPKEPNRIFCLKGGPGVGKSSLMKKLYSEFKDSKHNIELYFCPSDPNSLDALVIRDLNIAILDGTSPHIVDPKLPGAEDEIINLGDFLNNKRLEGLKNEIKKIDKDISESFREAYKFLESARPIYDNIMLKNSSNLNLGKINKMTDEFINDLSKNIKNKGDYKSKSHMFGSAITPFGIVDNTEYIFPEDAKVYNLVGDIGFGRSTFMSRVSDFAEMKGLKVYVYHDRFVPDKIESIYIEDLNVGLTKSENYNGNEKIDFYSYIRKDSLDVSLMKTTFNDLINNAIMCLKNAKFRHDDIEKYYVDNMNFDKVNEVKENLIKRIREYEK